VDSQLSTRDVERVVGHRLARCWSRVLLVASGRLFERESDDAWREYSAAR